MPWGKAQRGRPSFPAGGRGSPRPLGKWGYLHPRHMSGLCPHLLGLSRKVYVKAPGWCWARSFPARDKCVPSVNGSSFWKSCHRECLAANRSLPTEPCVTHQGRQPASRGQEGICPQGSQRGAWDSGPHLGLISSPPHSLLSYSVSSFTYFMFYPGLERNSIPAVWGASPERLGSPQTH